MMNIITVSELANNDYKLFHNQYIDFFEPNQNQHFKTLKELVTDELIYTKLCKHTLLSVLKKEPGNIPVVANSNKIPCFTADIILKKMLLQLLQKVQKQA